MPHGKAPGWPSAPLTINAMVFRHSRFPNAAKAFLMFMLEADQFEPWLNANLGYWAHPLAAYRAASVWTGDPKVAIFRDSMSAPFWNGYKGPLSAASGQANSEYVLVQMFASVASGQATPQQAAQEAERRARRIFRRG
jgi:multiple sugar transport system substrate-binding protein